MNLTPHLREALLCASRRELKQRLGRGHPVDPRAIEGWAYRGISLGLPRAVERLTWKTFQKVFWREPESGRLLGWNVRLEQDGVTAPSRPRQRRGAPWTTWFFEVCSTGDGLVIDYSRGPNPPFDTIRLVKDPLVSLEPGDADVLLGVSRLGPLDTPTYFLLEREHPVDHVPACVLERAGGGGPLLGFERRWAELLFAALLGTPLPEDLDAFWRTLGSAPPPYFAPGLRAAVHALTFLPVSLPALRRPVFALSAEQRLDYAARLDDDERLLVRQMVSTLKVIGCFALFADGRGRT